MCLFVDEMAFEIFEDTLYSKKYDSLDVPPISPHYITLIAIFSDNARDPEKAYFTKEKLRPVSG